MPRLYCEAHGREREVDIIANQDMYREEGEAVLVVKGRLSSGPFLCDRCNAGLDIGDRASLISSFPKHFYDSLHGYDFSYELAYFAMTKNDEAASYGAQWPDDSIRHRRPVRRKQPARRPICALDLFKAQ